MKFKDQFTKENPPKSVISTRSRKYSALSRPRRRLSNVDYCKRLKELYDGVLTQAEIVDVLNREFEGCSLRLSQLKKELRFLGLRRNQRHPKDPSKVELTFNGIGGTTSFSALPSKSISRRATKRPELADDNATDSENSQGSHSPRTPRTDDEMLSPIPIDDETTAFVRSLFPELKLSDILSEDVFCDIE